MANYKMNPGSKQKNTPGGFNQKQTNTLQKLTPQQKQGKKTLDSIALQRDLHKIDRDFDKKMCNQGGVCSSAGTRRRRKESRVMDQQETRARSLVKGYRVGPNPYN